MPMFPRSLKPQGEPFLRYQGTVQTYKTFVFITSLRHNLPNILTYTKIFLHNVSFSFEFLEYYLIPFVINENGFILSTRKIIKFAYHCKMYDPQETGLTSILTESS